MRNEPGRPHRLPAKDYEGERTVSFDACTWDRVKLFTTSEVVQPQVEFLRRAAAEFECVVPIYCFMPDHLHVMLMGESKHSNALKAMGKFKTLSGKWMQRKKLVGWQGDFYDHIVRSSDDWKRHASYIALNPVRAGLVTSCFDYPFSGSIGMNFQDVVLPWE